MLNIAQCDLLDGVDSRRREADLELSPANRAEMGQFLTPAPVARFMASLFSNLSGTIALLDILAGVGLLRDQNTLFAPSFPGFTHCIMNPPYRKIHSKSRSRLALKEIGVETSNLYSGFLAVAIQLLAPGGELIAIVPRSFCNGVYFKPFREMFLREMALQHLHVFEARDQVFKDNDVLQENIILHAIKGGIPEWVEITSSCDPELQGLTCRQATYAQVVKPSDPHRFINIVVSESDQLVVDRLSMFTSTLDSLDIAVSTGPVVDFRLAGDLRQQPEPGTLPLIYPGHIRRNFIDWPKLTGRKPNAIIDTEQSRPWLMPNGWYVVTRRFSAKEEKRRIVAAIHSPQRVQADRIGFENHLNVFHCAGAGLECALANGLALYLNSTLVDLYFRQFSGHTQVNATDLRALPYPSRDRLIRLGQEVDGDFPDQFTIDAILEREISTMTTLYRTADPAEMHRKIQEALAIR
jgi:adenine-specific DNA-methyltransferase